MMGLDVSLCGFLSEIWYVQGIWVLLAFGYLIVSFPIMFKEMIKIVKGGE